MNKLKTRTETIIEVSDWNNLVSETYGRPYNFQQQDGCKERGMEHVTVPLECEDGFENDTVPEIVNHRDMGVSFKAWLSRDPNKKLSSKEDQNSSSLGLWWDRNFYPDIQMVANDLHKRGLLDAGTYIINIDW